MIYDIKGTKEGQTSHLSNTRIKRKIGDGKKTSNPDNKSGLIPSWVKTAILGGTMSGIAFFGISKLFKRMKDNDD